MLCQLSMGQGPCIVLLPGWSFRYTIWLQLAQQLATRFTLQLWDLPGYGSTQQASQPDTLAATVELLLSELPPSAHLLGWSYGGLLAQAIACQAPERVQSLVTLGSTPRFLAAPGWHGVEADIMTQFSQQLVTAPNETLRQFALLSLGTRSYQKSQLTACLAHQVEPTQALLPSLIRGLACLRDSDMRDKLNDYQGPTCRLRGSDDPLCPDNIGVYQQVLAGVTHVPQLTHPLLLQQAVSEFYHVTFGH